MPAPCPCWISVGLGHRRPLAKPPSVQGHGPANHNRDRPAATQPWVPGPYNTRWQRHLRSQFRPHAKPEVPGTGAVTSTAPYAADKAQDSWHQAWRVLSASWWARQPTGRLGNAGREAMYGGFPRIISWAASAWPGSEERSESNRDERVRWTGSPRAQGSRQA